MKLYDNKYNYIYNIIISKFKNIDGWLTDINYNFRVKQVFLFLLTLFDIYIEKLEGCLKEAS